MDLSTASIEEILRKLDEYYTPVTALYEALATQEPAHASAPILKDFIELRQGRLIPYLGQLSEKAGDGHNCATCTGSCRIEHRAYLVELQESHSAMEEVLRQLNAPGLQPELKRLLTTAMLIESTYLVPAISKAQMFINVKD
jgi:hypothetical protein